MVTKSLTARTELKWQKSRSPHITAFVDQFNRVSAWVAGQIVDTQTLEKRLLVLSHFIQTAKLLRRLQVAVCLIPEFQWSGRSSRWLGLHICLSFERDLGSSAI